MSTEKNTHTHILQKAVYNKNWTNWYDNPDIQDFMIALFSGIDNSICLDLMKEEEFYGFSREVDTLKFKKYNDLIGKILYKPIITLKNDLEYNKNLLEKTFEHIRTKYKKKEAPNLILCPVLLGGNHFGLIYINFENGKAKPHFFEAFGGKDHAYKEHIGQIANFIKSKFKAGLDIDTTRYQQDGSSCGPYMCEKIRILIGKTSRESLHKQKSSDDIGEIIKYRQEHAQILTSYNSNFAAHILLTQKDNILEGKINSLNLNEFGLNSSTTTLDAHKLDRYNLSYDKLDSQIDGIDIFELQQTMLDKVKQVKNSHNIQKVTLISEPNFPKSHDKKLDRIGMAITGITAAILIITGILLIDLVIKGVMIAIGGLLAAGFVYFMGRSIFENCSKNFTSQAKTPITSIEIEMRPLTQSLAEQEQYQSNNHGITD